MTIALIGAGNVALHLGQQLRACGIVISQVYSRHLERARDLGDLLHAMPISQWEALHQHADAYLLAVSDDAIRPVGETLANRLPADSLVIHTSGATPRGLLADLFPRAAVLYPLQTLSRNRHLDFFTEVPLCYDAGNPDDLALLAQLARQMSAEVHQLDDDQRARCHLAAVFANNFSNHLFQIAAELLAERELPFSLIRPLIRETAAKVQAQLPETAQTGPARRGDQATLQRHVAQLSAYPELQAIYQLFSDHIQQSKK